MQRTHFTLGVNTEAYFGCSVVYNGDTFILGGKKEPNQVISHLTPMGNTKKHTPLSLPTWLT